MPELPEVEVTRRGIAPHLTGRRISGVAVRESRLRWPVPREVHALAGRTVRTIRRRGKYLVVDCGDGHLILHLGMSGSLRVLPPRTPAGKHDHFDLVLGDRVLRLRDPRRFGAVLWTAGDVAAHPLLAHLGVEPLSRAPALSQFQLRNAAAAPGVLLPPATPANGEAAIALRAGVYVPGENLEATIGGRQHVYMPQGVAERGEDYEIVRFREMVRE